MGDMSSVDLSDWPDYVGISRKISRDAAPLRHGLHCCAKGLPRGDRRWNVRAYSTVGWDRRVQGAALELSYRHRDNSIFV